MNLYERVQLGMDYIENNLNEKIKRTDAAKHAFMSRTCFCRLFNAFTGYEVREYIRKRRYEFACNELENNTPVKKVALKYGFSSQDDFYSSFEIDVGAPIASYLTSDKKYEFKKISIVDNLFEEQDETLKSKYPEISVIKNMPKMRVASYWSLSESPEREGNLIITKWAKKNNLLSSESNARIFGFDYPSYFARKRGYEYWITVPEGFQFKENDICKERVFDGGMYALITIEYRKGDDRDFVGKLLRAMERFAKWCRESKYGFAFHQYLEETVPGDADSDTQRLYCYFPISRNPDSKNPVVTTIPELTAAVFVENNKDFKASEKAWDLYYKWSEMSGDYKKHRVFQVQDSLNNMYDSPVEIWVTDPPEGVDLSKLDIRKFYGGRYLKFTTLFKSAMSELEDNCYKIYMNGDYTKLKEKLFIEYQGMNDNLNDRMKFWIYYPLR